MRIFYVFLYCFFSLSLISQNVYADAPVNFKARIVDVSSVLQTQRSVDLVYNGLDVADFTSDRGDSSTDPYLCRGLVCNVSPGVTSEKIEVIVSGLKSTTQWSVYYEADGVPYGSPDSLDYDNANGSGIPYASFSGVGNGTFLSSSFTGDSFATYIYIRVEPDPIAFENSTPSIDTTTSTQVVIDVDMDTASTVYAVMVPSFARAPSVEQIVAGENAASASAVSSGNIDLSSGGFSGQLSLSGFTAQTDDAYKIYIVSQDSAGYQSEVSKLHLNYNTPPVFNETIEFQSMVQTTALDARELELIDVDNDGDLDVVMATQGTGNSVVWAENDGRSTNGGFDPNVTQIGPSITDAASKDSADVDGDGDIDFAVVGASNNKVYYYSNNGDGTFAVSTIATSASPVFPGALYTIFNDFDSDGAIDIVVADATNDRIFWFKNDGSESFAQQTPIAIDGADLVFFDIADFNADGNKDLLLGDTTGDAIKIAFLDSSQAVSSYEEILGSDTTKINDPYRVFVVDLDGNGGNESSDVIFFGNTTGHVYYAKHNLSSNNPTKLDTPVLLSMGVVTGDIARVADINNDSYNDIVVSGIDAGVVEYYLGNASGTYSSGVSISDDDATAMQIGDFNNDGLQDVLIGDEINNVQKLAKGAYVKSINHLEDSSAVGTYTASDVDGDTITYSLSGADAGDFSIDSSTGALSFVNTPDYHDPQDVGTDNAYNIQIDASANGQTVSLQLTVNVTSLDNDADGVSNTQEASDGTDPNDPLSFVDTDSDGVPDYFDLGGVGFLSGTYVDASGVALDSDNDGVIDYVEAFPGANDAPVFTDGALSSSISFDRDSNQYASVNNQSLDLTGDKVTIAAWINPSDTTNGEIFVKSIDSTATKDVDYGLRYRTNGKVIMHVADGTNYYYCESNALLGINDWFYLVGSYEKGVGIKLYFDSVDQDVTCNQNNGFNFDFGTNGDATFARYNDSRDSSGGIQYFDGGLDDFAVWDDVLAQAEITAIYNNGNYVPTLLSAQGDYDSHAELEAFWRFADEGGSMLTDETGNGNTATLVNSPSFVTRPVEANVFENTTAITTYAATDADGDDLTYTIFGGADQSKFTVSSTTAGAVLSFTDAPDFETATDSDSNNVYEVTLQVSDGTATETLAISVTVVDDSTAPSFENSTPSLNTISISTLTMNYQIDEAGTVYSLVGDSDSSAPSVSDVVNGTTGSAYLEAGNTSLAAATAGTLTSSGLAQSDGTFSLKVYSVAKDIEGNQSSVNTTTVTFTDTDADGIENSVDTDDDGDGVPDTDERNTAEALLHNIFPDADNDGVPDYFDLGGAGYAASTYVDSSGVPLDNDGDGVLDYEEAFAGQNDPPIFSTADVRLSAANLSILNSPRGVALGDVDNDGDLDLAVSLSSANSVEVLFNDGSGQFGSAVSVISDNSPKVTHIADLDKDGNLDVIASFGGGSLQYALGNGDGSFQSEVSIGGFGFFRDIDTGDFDSDGDIDVLVGDETYNKVYLLINDGTETFTRSTLASGNDADDVRTVKFTDLDNDGDLDVVAVASDTDRLIWIENNGPSGDFSVFSVNAIDASAKYVTAADVADIDRDGDLDIAILAGSNSGNTERVVWYKNDGNQTFTKIISPIVPIGYAADIKIVDMDNDRDLDIVLGLGYQIEVFSNDGLQNFSGSTSDSRVDGIYNIAVGDVNGDGALQVVTANASQNRVYTVSAVQYKTISMQENQSAVIDLGGFDPDGDPYTFSFSGGADDSEFTLNTTTGVLTFAANPNFESPTDADSNNEYLVSVRVSDGTLYSDLSIPVTITDDTTAPSFTNSTPSLNTLSQSALTMSYEADDASTVYTLVGNSTAATPNAATVVAGSVTGNYIGAANTALTANTADTLSVSGLNRTDNVFTLRVFSVVRDSENNNSAVSTTLVEYRDTDGDGTPDAIDTDDDGDGVPDTSDSMRFIYGAADSDGDGVPNYFDLGGDGYVVGVFVDSSGVPIDTDNDDVSDYLETYPGQNKPPVFDDIEATFTQSTINASDANLRTLDVGDVDLDGDVDIVIAQAQTNSSVILYLNNGDSTFTRQLLQTFNGESFWDLELADITGDGYLDIVFANDSATSNIYTFVHSGDISSPYPNSVVTSGAVANRIQKLTVADVTNDGLADVVFSSIVDDTLEYLPSDPDSTVLSASPVLIGSGLDYAFSVDVDFAGNVYITSLTDKKLSIFANNGTDNPFGSVNSSGTTITGPTGFSPNLLSVANLDNDVQVEIIVADNGQELYLFDYDGSTWQFTKILDGSVVSALNSFGVHEIETLDIDLDGDVDILLSTWQSDDVLWLENDGDQTFGNDSARIVYNTASNSEPLTVVSGDITNDGIADFVTRIGSALTLFTGTFEQTFTVDENTIYVGSIAASDPEGESVTYSLSGHDQSLFSVSSSGELSFSIAPNFESPTDNDTNNVYEVVASAIDASGESLSANYTITIVNDTTGPIFRNSTPSVESQTATTVVYTTDVNETSTVYGMLMQSSASCPSVAQLKAQSTSGITGAISADSGSISSNPTTVDLSFTGIDLGAATTYKACFVAQDAEPNDGSVVERTLSYADTDSDGTPDIIDNDDDGDGVPDTEDAFPLDSTEFRDTDNDGTGDNADTDDDNDGTVDSSDDAPRNPAIQSITTSILIDETLATAINTALESGDVNIDITGTSTLDVSSHTIAGDGDIIIDEAITWSTNNKLSFTALDDVIVNDNITASGDTASLEFFHGRASPRDEAISTSEMVINLRNKAVVTLSGTSPTLYIANHSYDVFNSHDIVADLRAMGTSAETYVALGEGFVLTDTYNSAFFTTTFTGRFDGLGNAIEGLKIVGADGAGGNFGLFASVKAASIRHVGVVNLDILTNADSRTVDKIFAGGLIALIEGDSVADVSSIEGNWTTGSIRAKTGSEQLTFYVGGFIGHQNSGEATITRSYSTVNVSAKGSYSDALSLGSFMGNTGVNETGVTPHTTTTGAVVNTIIDSVYATGSSVSGDSSEYGAYIGIGNLIGVFFSTGLDLDNAFAIGNGVAPNNGSFGGVGYALGGTFDAVYTSLDSFGSNAATTTNTFAGETALNTATSNGTVLPTGFASSIWELSNGQPILRELPAPPIAIFVKQTKTSGAVGAPDLDYQLVDANGDQVLVSSLTNVTGVAGTAIYTIDADTPAGSYEVSYVGGLRLTGSGAGSYELAPFDAITYTLNAKTLVTYSISDVSGAQGSTTALPTPVFTGGTPTGTIETIVVNSSNVDVSAAYNAGSLPVGVYTIKATLVDASFAIAGSGNTFGTLTLATDTDGDGVPDTEDAFPNDPNETTDTDGDGVGDNSDAFPNDPAENRDSDGDGVGDNEDAYPNNPNRTNNTDSDGDGVPDEIDAFPNDANESVDTDGDGVGDNGDAFPNDPAENRDSDGDGVGDNQDAYPNNPTRTNNTDTDGDGVPDEIDAFPNDADESVDTDGDGVGDNGDTFPNDPTENRDSDGDGVGDNQDAYPNNPTRTNNTDTDGDGVPDEIDAFPNDADESLDTDGDGIGNNRDTDDDGDGVNDDQDQFPLDLTKAGDTDADGIDDLNDDDIDGDGLNNDIDNDANGDGIVDDNANNTAPIAVGDVVDIVNTTPITINVLANDFDLNQDTLVVDSVSTRVGDIDITDGSVRYTAPENFTGSAIAKYVVSDGIASTKGTILLNINTFSETSAAPLVLPPEGVEVNATGLFTRVDLGIATATDAAGRRLPVSLVDGVTLFKPGVNTAYWAAVDANGHRTVSSQQVLVRPLVSFAKDQAIAEGESGTVRIVLNGESPEYPLDISFVVAGTASDNDHSLRARTVTITEGLETSVNFNTNTDAVAEGDETITLQFNGELNAVSDASHIITITEQAQIDELSLAVKQMGQNRRVVAQNDGNVTILSRIEGASSQNQYTYTWSSNAALLDIDSIPKHFTFDPATVDTGMYRFTVEASSVETNASTLQTSIDVVVVDSLAALSDTVDTDGDDIPDSVEGYNDSDADGIPDYADANEQSNVIPAVTDTSDAFLVEGEPGVSLRIGATGIANNTNAAGIIMDNIANVDSEYNNVGGLFDFEILRLEVVGQTSNVVLPQLRPIPENPVYRKFNTASGWTEFIVDANNAIASTAGETGYCPPPNASAWTIGLTPGHWCVRLSIEDGGPNDADGIANRKIVDPGGIGLLSSSNQLPVAQDDSLRMRYNTSASVNVLANDTDADGDSLQIMQASSEFGTVEVSGEALIFTPIADYYGEVTIDYAVSDGSDVYSYASVNVIIFLNNAPTPENDTASTDDRSAITVDVLANDTDPEGDALSISDANASAGTVAIVENQLRYTPQLGYEGTVSVMYTVEDEQGLSAQATLTISIDLVEVIEVQNNQSSSGGAINLYLSILLGLMIMLRRLGGVHLVLVATQKKRNVN